MRGKRDWRRWWPGYLAHWITGAAVAFCLLTPGYQHIGYGLLTLAVAYQIGEFLKYADAIAIDLKDLMIGFGVGAAATIAFRVLFPGAYKAIAGVFGG